MAETGEIITERRGRAQWITIDREERRNALNGAVIEGLHAALLAADADPAVRVIVLTGAGRKAFCAGADLGGGAAVFGDDADRPTTGFGRFPMQVLVYLRGMMHPRHVNELCQTGAMIDAARAR